MQTIQHNKPLDPEPLRSSNTTHAHANRFLTRRPAINITPIERSGRVVLGAIAAIAGTLLLLSAGSVLAVILEAMLIAAGLDLVITGALGHCPLYKKLGCTPTSLRRST